MFGRSSYLKRGILITTISVIGNEFLIAAKKTDLIPTSYIIVIFRRTVRPEQTTSEPTIDGPASVYKQKLATGAKSRTDCLTLK